MSKFSVGNYVRLTKLGEVFTDQVGVVESVHREKHWWAYNVRFGDAIMPVAEHHLVLAESIVPPVRVYSKGGFLDVQDLTQRREQLTKAAKEAAEPDPVNHPQHYGGDTTYEVIKVAEAWGLDKDAYLFNVLKYVARAGKKVSALEDLDKGAFYLARRRAAMRNQSA